MDIPIGLNVRKEEVIDKLLETDVRNLEYIFEKKLVLTNDKAPEETPKKKKNLLYTAYLQEQYKIRKAENLSKSFSQLSREIKKDWEAMSEEEKERYGK